MNNQPHPLKPPSSDPKVNAARAYMRAYMAKRRAAQPTTHRDPAALVVGTAEHTAYSIAASIAATRRRARPGFCDTCGIAEALDSRCPLCRDSDAGLPVDLLSWEAVVMQPVA